MVGLVYAIIADERACRSLALSPRTHVLVNHFKSSSLVLAVNARPPKRHDSLLHGFVIRPMTDKVPLLSQNSLKTERHLYKNVTEKMKKV